MDPLTERMENLRWARILVKPKEESCQVCWRLESRGHLTTFPFGGRCRRCLGRIRRAIGVHLVVAAESGLGGLFAKPFGGNNIKRGWKWWVGPEVGPMGFKGKEKVSDVPIRPPAILRDNLGLVEIQPIDKGPLGRFAPQPNLCPVGKTILRWSFLSLREKEAGRKQGFRDSGSLLILSCFRLAGLQRGSFSTIWGDKGGLPKGNLPSFQDAAGPSAIGNECGNWSSLMALYQWQGIRRGFFGLNFKKEGRKGL
ncbi:hypothetical protein CK203_047502 [Vitis vinifera]|uniref:Uncharacterized protein n=1 Tax=Vitis vinifera TaxID=29760 RepID=A0A438H6D1_VITVI|nr:hypothetical protein CK203_047502 [Vitis vinifera]